MDGPYQCRTQRKGPQRPDYTLTREKKDIQRDGERERHTYIDKFGGGGGGGAVRERGGEGRVREGEGETDRQTETESEKGEKRPGSCKLLQSSDY